MKNTRKSLSKFGEMQFEIGLQKVKKQTHESMAILTS